MKTLNKIFLLIGMLAIVFSLQTCKKNHYLFKTRIEGTLTNKTTGEPMPNVEIKIFRSNLDHYGIPYTEYVSSFYTNEKGEFDYKFSPEKYLYKGGDYDYGYYIKPFVSFNGCYLHAGNFYKDGTLCPDEIIALEEGHKNNFQIEFEPFPPATLNIHVKNQSPYNMNDSIYICYIKLGMEPKDDCINPFGSFKGMNIDTNIIVSLNQTYWLLQWNVTKNSVMHGGSQAFNPLNEGNTYYEILY